MPRKIQIIIGVIVLAAMLLACGSIPSSPTLVAQEPGAVATMVQATLQALLQTPGSTASGVTATAPEALPRSLYFVNSDASGIIQVYRLERDGTTLTQITHEVTNVGPYGVASDGRLAYVANNQLLLENADGSGRHVLVDGGAVDPNNQFINSVSSPVWSRDNQVIAFGYHGLSFYDLANGTFTTVVSNNIDNVNGLVVPRELFSPNEYSPDGTYLLVNIGWYEGGTYGIYQPATNALVKPSMQGILCCALSWGANSSAVYFASSTVGMIDSGLWRFDPIGTVTTLIPSQAADGTYNFADYPYLAPDGQLYYFYANRADIPSGHTPLNMVRSSPDGVTGRTVLLADPFTTLNGALWAPDASLVVTVEAPVMDLWSGGALTAVYLDGRPELPLAAFGMNPQWGP